MRGIGLKKVLLSLMAAGAIGVIVVENAAFAAEIAGNGKLKCNGNGKQKSHGDGK